MRRILDACRSTIRTERKSSGATMPPSRATSPAYADPVSGLSVFTADFLAVRGDCCESGCRHCPYLH